MVTIHIYQNMYFEISSKTMIKICNNKKISKDGLSLLDLLKDKMPVVMISIKFKEENKTVKYVCWEA